MQLPVSEGEDICCQLGVSLQAEGVRGEDSRIAFTIGAIFLIPHGEPFFQTALRAPSRDRFCSISFGRNRYQVKGLAKLGSELPTHPNGFR